MEDELVEEPDFDIQETRCTNSGHKSVQVLAGSAKFEAGKSGKNNSFCRRWRNANVARAGRGRKEMERKALKLSHPGQHIRERFR